MNEWDLCRRIRRHAAALGAALVLGTSPALAQSAGDLSCNGCVEKKDLAQGAISTAKLKNGSVKMQKLGKDVRARFDALESHVAYVAVPGAAVRPDSDRSTVQITTLGSVSSLKTDDTFLLGAVQLPHLMVIDGMSCVLADRDDTAYIQVSLLRCQTTDLQGRPGAEPIASLGTGRPSLGEEFTTLSANVREQLSVVDNQHYQYQMRVDMLDVPSPATSRIELLGCTIRLVTPSE